MKNKASEIYVKGYFDSGYFFSEGQCSGNGTEYSFRVDGNQWGISEFEKNDDGFVLTFYGEWEASELLRAMAQLFFIKCPNITKDELMNGIEAYRETVEIKRERI